MKEEAKVEENSRPFIYEKWLSRFSRVLSAYNSNLISLEDLEKFQLFLIDYGYFNASFTLEELEQLKYPLSPFAITNFNSYARSKEDWATKMLKKQYQDEFGSNFFPIFVHSNLFWKELERYLTVISVSKEKVVAKEESSQEWNKILKDKISIIDGSLVRPVLFKLEDKDPKDREFVEEKLRLKILDIILDDQNIQGNLKNLFINSVTHPNSKNKNHEDLKEDEEVDREDILKFLSSSKVERKFRLKILNIILDDQNIQGNLKNLFINSVTHPNSKNKNHKDLKEYETVNREDILKFLVFSKKDYFNAIRSWYETQFPSAYFFCDEFKSKPTMVLCSNPPRFVNNAVNSLGYRIPLIETVRMVLKLENDHLFYKLNVTKNFFKKLVDISRKKEEKAEIGKFSKKFCNIFKDSTKKVKGKKPPHSVKNT